MVLIDTLGPIPIKNWNMPQMYFMGQKKNTYMRENFTEWRESLRYNIVALTFA